VTDSAGTVTLSKGDLRALWRVDQLTPGDEAHTGFTGSETIEGGAGDDALTGAGGSDTYIRSRGDGDDLIIEPSFSGTADALRPHGVDPADVIADRAGDEAILLIADAPGGPGAMLRLTDTLGAGSQAGIESVIFDDGTIWGASDLRAAYFARLSTPGDDALAGFASADTLEGGQGDDHAAGARGSDTYVWRHGDGCDRIVEESFGGTLDRLALPDAFAAEVTVSRDGDTAILTIAETIPGAGNGGRLQLLVSLSKSSQAGVEEIEFADGAIRTQSIMRARLLADQAGAGADLILGFGAGDILAGGWGADVLRGGGGMIFIAGRPATAMMPLRKAAFPAPTRWC
jgi:Ca2+-binding RTX toxin-like protein